ncbi:hypothetical protein [Tessaracoccus coleopterorum]|uniref:hypothetical protein n=1 Tax=Tessaracoccus coleopterorum TaxID=2714950 RepID=UPI0018D45522|nr:hypothetical protein [Tessaracoccus coleopterorum]
MFISGPWMMSLVEDMAAQDGDTAFADKYDVAPSPPPTVPSPRPSSVARTWPCSRTRRTGTRRGRWSTG